MSKLLDTIKNDQSDLARAARFVFWAEMDKGAPIVLAGLSAEAFYRAAERDASKLAAKLYEVRAGEIAGAVLADLARLDRSDEVLSACIRACAAIAAGQRPDHDDICLDCGDIACQWCYCSEQAEADWEEA